MTLAVINEFIDAVFKVVQLLGGLATFAILVRQARGNVQRDVMEAKIDSVHHNVKTLSADMNGMQAKLVESTAKASHAEGMADQVTIQTQIDADVAKALKTP